MRGFLKRHPESQMKFAVIQDYQKLHASHLTSIRDYFNGLGAVLRKCGFRPRGMYGIGRRGLHLGVYNWVRVIVRRRQHPPAERIMAPENGLQLLNVPVLAGYLITLPRAPSMLFPLEIYKGKGLYRSK